MSDGDTTETDAGSDPEYEVESIERERFNARLKRTEYFVKWKGFNELTWEPEENVQNCSDALVNFKLDSQLKPNAFQDIDLTTDSPPPRVSNRAKRKTNGPAKKPSARLSKMRRNVIKRPIQPGNKPQTARRTRNSKPRPIAQIINDPNDGPARNTRHRATKRVLTGNVSAAVRAQNPPAKRQAVSRRGRPAAGQSRPQKQIAATRAPVYKRGFLKARNSRFSTKDVEWIFAERRRGSGRREFLVHWAAGNSSTWEAEADLEVEQVEQFEAFMARNWLYDAKFVSEILNLSNDCHTEND
eukprot:509978_1